MLAESSHTACFTCCQEVVGSADWVMSVVVFHPIPGLNIYLSKIDFKMEPETLLMLQYTQT